MIVRGFFIVSLLLWVAALDEVLPIFILTLCSIFLLYIQGFKVAYMLKSLRLLMWLFVPILILHGLFTPGRLIQQPIYIPLSIEGLERGLYLSAHISLIFFCALLVFRVFTKQEWFNLMSKLPQSEQLKTYLILLMTLKDEISTVLKQTKNDWFEQGKPWGHLPQLMVESVQEVLRIAKHEAKDLWENWDTRIVSFGEAITPLWSAKEFMYLGLLIFGWGLFWLI